jgi:mRNA interferase YafQ
MRQPDYSGQFKRDVKLAQKRGKEMDKLKTLLGLLIDGAPLPLVYLDHPLQGDWKGFRDTHIEPDQTRYLPRTADRARRPHHSIVWQGSSAALDADHGNWQRYLGV